MNYTEIIHGNRLVVEKKILQSIKDNDLNVHNSDITATMKLKLKNISSVDVSINKLWMRKKSIN